MFFEMVKSGIWKINQFHRHFLKQNFAECMKNKLKQNFNMQFSFEK